MMLCCRGSSAFLRAAWGVARLPLFGAPGAAGCLEVPKCLFVTGITGNRTWQQNLATEPGTYQGFSHLCHHLHARRLRCRHMVAIANSSLFFAHLNLNLQLASTMNTSNCPAVALGTAATCRPGTVPADLRTTTALAGTRTVLTGVSGLCTTSCLRPRLFILQAAGVGGTERFSRGCLTVTATTHLCKCDAGRGKAKEKCERCIMMHPESKGRLTNSPSSDPA